MRPEPHEDMGTTFHLLTDGARLRLDEGACLPLRSDFGGCRACATSCPAKVLDVSVDRVALADGCLHCGRCVAACPTEALQLDGFDVDELPAGPQPIEVECAKVPANLRTAQSIAVPCLGGLSAGRIAALHEAAGGRGISLVDRGWCGRCSAGGGSAHPAGAALDRVVLWLDAVHDPRPAPRLLSRPLPAEQMPAEIPAPPEPVDPGPALSRRQFFRTLASDPVGRTRRAAPMGGDGRAAFPTNQRRESPERRRLLDALDAAAGRGATTLPSEFFPRLSVIGVCADHRVCTAACPTGALKVVATEGAASLTFASTACIGCGACARSCPEGALAVETHGGERAPMVLVHHTQQVCSTCGDVFTPRAGEALCPACSKTQRFIGDAMSQLFGARH
jgi:ferredoxin